MHWNKELAEGVEGKGYHTNEQKEQHYKIRIGKIW